MSLDSSSLPTWDSPSGSQKGQHCTPACFQPATCPFLCSESRSEGLNLISPDVPLARQACGSRTEWGALAFLTQARFEGSACPSIHLQLGAFYHSRCFLCALGILENPRALCRWERYTWDWWQSQEQSSHIPTPSSVPHGLVIGKEGNFNPWCRMHP